MNPENPLQPDGESPRGFAGSGERTELSESELIHALSDGELDLRDHPDALSKLASDPLASKRVASQQQLKEACVKAMDGPTMRCPDSLAKTLRELAFAGGDVDDRAGAKPVGLSVQPALSRGVAGSEVREVEPAVIARIGRWLPTAAAAVLLIAAGALFMQNSTRGGGMNTQAAAFLSVDQIDRFTGRHGDCALKPEILKQSDRFVAPGALDQLPGKLGSYFQTSTDGMRLSLDGMGYDYQLAGACTLPGEGAVHVVYKNRHDTSRSISLWVLPTGEQHAGLEPGRVYVEAGSDSQQQILFWREGGLLYHLFGDSIEDANKAVKTLRQSA